MDELELLKKRVDSLEQLVDHLADLAQKTTRRLADLAGALKDLTNALSREEK